MADDDLEYYPLPEGYGAEPTARIRVGPQALGEIASTDYQPDAFEAAAGRVQRRYAAPQRAVLPAGPNDVMDTLRSIPRGIMGGLADTAAAGGQAAAIEMGDDRPQPTGEEGLNLLEQNVTGALPQPVTEGGRVGASIGHVAGNPGNWVTPGRIPLTAGYNVASGITSELGRKLYEGTPNERIAQVLGGFGPAVAERAAALYKFLPQGSAGAIGGRLPQPTMDVPMRPGSGGMSDIAAPPRARTLFDYSRINEVPDVPQVDLPRYAPPRGTSPRVQDLITNPAVAQQMLNKIEEGRNINAQTFYYNEPLRQAFISELGKRKGDPAFARYMDYVAASSPRSDVEANARNASYYYMLQQQGLPVPAKGGVNPQPYGHMAQNLHRLNAERIRSGDYFDAIKNPKPLSFSANLQGNFAPVTVDAHAFKLPGMLARDPRFLATSVGLDKGVTVYPQRMFNSGEINMEDALARPVYWASKPNANEYGAMEQYYKQLAQQAGMAPAQAQAAAWAGGGPMTGLASVAGDPFMRSVENRANLTAARRGISPQEALSRMIRGREPLLALPFIPAAGAVMGGLAQQDSYQ